MARKSDGSVYIDTLVDTRGFDKGVKSIKNQMGGLGSAVSKLGGIIAAAFAVKQLVQFGKSAIQLGSDLQEVQNVVDVTFSSMSDKVNEFAKGAAEAAGLSETMAKRYIGTFGAMAKAFGFAESESFNMSAALTQLAGDVASFYNLTQDEAYTKLKSVFTGETETLKDLGVVMTQSALDSYAMAKGIGKTTKQMSEQEKVALRYSFVMDQLSAAQGDFARTSDSWANQTRILSLNFDTFKANIGQALINIFTPFLKVINQIVSKMAQLSSYFVAFSEMLVGKSTSGGGGSPGSVLEDMAGGYDDVASSAQKAEKAQNKYLSGLDEIRTFTSKDTSGEGSTGVSSGVDITGFDNTTNILKQEIKNTADLIAELEEKFPKLTTFLKDSFENIKEIIRDFSVGDFYEAGKDISSLVSGIYEFFSDAVDSVDWQGIGNKIGDFLAGVDWFGIIKSALELKFNIWEAIAELWFGAFEKAPFETILLSAFGVLNFTPIGKLLSTKLLSAFLAAISAGGFAAKIAEAFKLAIGGAVTLSEAFTAVFGTVGATVSGILGVVGGAVTAVTSFIKMLQNGFSWFNEVIMLVGIGLTALGAIILGAPAVVTGVIAGIVAALATLVVVVKDNWEKITETINKFLTFFKNEVWENGIKKVFNQIASFITDVFVEKWKNAWVGVQDVLKGIINNMIKVIERFVNNAISLINGLISGVNDITGSLGISAIPLIPKFNIPKLATGAVIPPNAPFLAMLGDQKSGNNIEAPEDLIRKIVREETGGKDISGNVTIPVYFDGNKLFEIMIAKAKLFQASTGINTFVEL